MARRKCVVLKNFKTIKDNKITEYKKDDIIRLSKSRCENWKLNKLVK